MLVYYVYMNTFATQPKIQQQALQKALRSPLIGKHGKRKSTLVKEEIFKDAQNKIAERTLELMEKQYQLAIGDIRVFVVRSYWEGKGNNRKIIKGKPEAIKGEEKISEAIDYESGIRTGEENPNMELKHYFVIMKEPNLRAIDSLLNRVFGKATENKNLTVEHGMGALLEEEIDFSSLIESFSKSNQSK